MGEYELTGIQRMKPGFYLDVNQNHCDNSVDDTPWIFFSSPKDQDVYFILKRLRNTTLQEKRTLEKIQKRISHRNLICQPFLARKLFALQLLEKKPQQTEGKQMFLLSLYCVNLQCKWKKTRLQIVPSTFFPSSIINGMLLKAIWVVQTSLNCLIKK